LIPRKKTMIRDAGYAKRQQERFRYNAKIKTVTITHVNRLDGRGMCGKILAWNMNLTDEKPTCGGCLLALRKKTCRNS
jgi:hypothetical protein